MDPRRRSPPPRGRPLRGGPYDAPPDRFRRSRSPPDRRRGSPPPLSKRPRRDDDPYYGRFDDYRDGPRGPPPRGYPDPYYEGRRSRSPERHDADDPTKMMTFKQFLLKQSDDPSPEEAQQRYKEYLIEYHGGVIKAEFEETKMKESVRAQYDPRMFEKALAKRNEEAAESHARFLEDLADKKLEATAPGFNQGALDLAPKPAAAEPGKEDAAASIAYAPAFCWKPARIAADLVLARRLTRRVDFEKGFPADNPLLPVRSEDALKAQAAADEQDAKDAAAAKEEGKAAPTSSSKRFVEVEEETPSVDDDNYDECVGKLDLLLTYLWRVHGIDFYSGYELTAQEFGQRLTACRLLRGPKPEEGEGGSNAAEGQGEGTAAGQDGNPEEANSVEACWNRRITDGDPLEARCQRKKVEELLDKWIESQIVCHADNKWGSLVSPKLFMARKFVVKHIRTKHEDKVQAEKERLLDEVYFENFKRAKEEEQAAAEAEAEQQQQQQQQQQGDHPMEDAAGVNEEDGRGRGRGRGGMMGRGRGRMGMMPGMMMDPMAMMSIGMAPMMMPGPGGMPFPMMMPPMPMPMMPPAMMMGAMRGRGRMGMMAGRGGRGRGPRLDGAGREYYDLDNPQNNRAILDYGDL